MGKVIKIGISQISGSKVIEVNSVEAVQGKGLTNDRFFKDNNNKMNQLTLIEKEKIDDFNKEISVSIPYINFRRNIITEAIDLNSLLNKKIIIGETIVKAHNLCEPCRNLQENLNQTNLVKKLLNKGGLRCEILTSGKIFVGDIIKSYD